MTGSTDDSRPGGGGRPGRDETVGRAGQCPGCGRSTAHDVCLHCAAEDHFRSASLVRGFVAFPDREAPVPGRPPPAGPAHRPADRVRGVPDRTFSAPAFLPAPPRPVPRAGSTARTGHQQECSGWGPEKILLSVAIGLGAILLAALVGIVGAVMTGPVSGPGVDATSSTDPPG
ncbi:hypothetical protein ACTMS0_26545 [Micromonospora sp. H33]|uniref:hypothetical protein n=1 Tax=Micromonospora sp. H33 TaxID=3452215 RepID=UPI003F888CDF